MTDPFYPTALRLDTAPPVAIARTEDSLDALQSPTIAAVLRERMEQIEKHGYTRQHDDAHDGAEIGQGALAYLCAGLALELGEDSDAQKILSAGHLVQAADVWPWQPDMFRPTDYYACLIKTAAMCIAEADRVMIAQVLIDRFHVQP